MGNYLLKRTLWILLLVGALFIGSFSGCTTLNNLVSIPDHDVVNHQESALNEKAVAQFISRVRPYQESVESIFKRARYFQENRKYRLAIQEYHAVLSIDPDHIEAYNGLGVCYDTLEDYERAGHCYRKALGVNPALAHVQNNLGYSSYLRGELDGAIEAFKKAIDLNTDEALYHNNLGLAYAEKGLFEPAFEEFAIAYGAQVNSPTFAAIN